MSGGRDHGGREYNEAVLGTADYLAPEQAIDSHAVDGRADIYSLGCTFYFLLTGRPMYPGEGIAERVVAHREQAIPELSQLCPGVAEKVNSVFQRMVAKNPEDRYQSAARLICDLTNLLRYFYTIIKVN